MKPNTFFCIDGHTCGNPVRLVAGGGPPLDGRSMSEKRQDFLERYDWIRTGLMFEPRGHDMMSGSILYPPTREDCDVAVLFIETSGCLPMCGHGTIGTVTFALERGLVQPREEGLLALDTPAGRVETRYRTSNGAGPGLQVEAVRLTNVGAYLAAEGVTVDCPELGPLTFDIAYGGNFYAILEPQANYRDMGDLSAGDLVRLSPILRQRLNEATRSGPPGGPDDPRRQPHPLDRQADEPGGECPQRRLLRRQGNRPQPLRHRHLGTHGAARGTRRAQGRRRLRAREHHRLAVPRPGRGRDQGRQPQGHRALGRGLGADHRLQHDLHRRARSLRPRLPGAVKENWPRQKPLVALDAAGAARLLRPLYPNAEVEDVTPLPGGLVNTNLRVVLADESRPLLLRLYQREPGLARKEAAIARALADRLPVARFHLVAEDNPVTGHAYAVTDCIEGERLDLVAPDLTNDELAALGQEIGEALGRIHKVKFDRYGFFADRLAVPEAIDLDQRGILAFLQSCLGKDPARTRLGAELADALPRLMQRHGALIDSWLPPPCLVHGDFNPQNLLVARQQAGDQWHLAAILDWEFAFSGTPAFDLGNLIRPPLGRHDGFVAAVAAGYRESGKDLPKDWQRIARLVDLTAWVEMVSRRQVDAVVIEDARRLIRAALMNEEQR